MEPHMKYWLIGVMCFASLLSCYGSTNAQRPLPLSPAKVELRGQLVLQERLGPPTFGENPDTDMKLILPFLVPDEPISVSENEETEASDRPFVDLGEIQLICPLELECRALKGKTVLAQGELRPAISGQDFTKVVMDVKAIRIIQKSTR